MGEQSQSIVSTLQALYESCLDWGCLPCSGRDEINAKVPSIFGMLSHQPLHHYLQKAPQYSSCQRAVCDCMPSIQCSLPPEVLEAGAWGEIRK